MPTHIQSIKPYLQYVKHVSLVVKTESFQYTSESCLKLDIPSQNFPKNIFGLVNEAKSIILSLRHCPYYLVPVNTGLATYGVLSIYEFLYCS